jgi:hypothetical protein
MEHGQVQLIQRIEYPDQGSLIRKFALQSRNRRLIAGLILVDGHAFHAIHPVDGDSSLHLDLVDRRFTECYFMCKRIIHACRISKPQQSAMHQKV